MVNISLRVLSRPDGLSIPTIARELGSDYDEKGKSYVFYETANYF
jgi:hypothetical protein